MYSRYSIRMVERARELRKEGLSANAILRKLKREIEFKDEDFPSERQVLRWINEVPTVNENAKLKRNKKVVINLMESHFKKLSEVAASLLEDDLDKIEAYTNEDGKTKYIITLADEDKQISEKDLTASLIANMDITCRKFSSQRIKSFGAHLEAESEEIETMGLDNLIKSNPIRVIEILSTIIEREAFKGTCPVCEDWK